MKTEEKYKAELDKILKSKSFVKKELYQRLLKYLVDASFKGDVPKEVTIANDVFRKGKNFNAAEDTTVRVHMHKLRKNLEQYYQTDGQTDEMKLFIPKGHYQVTFIKNERSKIRKSESRKNISIILLAFALFLSLFYITFQKYIFPYPKQNIDLIDTKNKIWCNFFDNGYPVTFVIGDFFVFHEYSQELDRSRRIQDYQINTTQVFEEYSKNHPEKAAEKWFLGELPHNSIYNMIDINRVFTSYNQKMNIRFTSEIEIDYIKNRNIVYVGEFKNLRALSNLISVLPVKYETLPWWQGSLKYPEGDSIKVLETYHDWNVNRYLIDLGLVAKLPGQHYENYMIFAGFGYDSQVKTVEIFSRDNSIKELVKQVIEINGYMPEYFAMVFEISGFDRASTKAELKFFHEIEEDNFQYFNSAR